MVFERIVPLSYYLMCHQFTTYALLTCQRAVVESHDFTAVSLAALAYSSLNPVSIYSDSEEL